MYLLILIIIVLVGPPRLSSSLTFVLGPPRQEVQSLALCFWVATYKDTYYTQLLQYVPVLKQTMLRLLAFKVTLCKQAPQQGNCKHAFCQAVFPDGKRITTRPLAEDRVRGSDKLWLLNKSLYCLRCSPRH